MKIVEEPRFGGVANERHSALRNNLAVGQVPQLNLTKQTATHGFF
jgi:hypothetical protein